MPYWVTVLNSARQRDAEGGNHGIDRGRGNRRGAGGHSDAKWETARECDDHPRPIVELNGAAVARSL